MIEWSFLDRLMRKLGFEDGWVNKIMKCVQSVSYAVKINNVPKGLIWPERGLRQGDPISPYLFLLCAQGLSELLSFAQTRKRIRGIKIANESPEISHLLFANDSLLFLQASRHQVGEVLRLLDVYGDASGQRVNIDKSTIVFSPNVIEEDRTAILNMMGVRVADNLEKYLGMPAWVGRSKKQTLGFIKEQIENRLKGWKESLLSKAGRGVLVKAVAQTIPTYLMNCFKFPKDLCREINSMISKFWWG